jgi:death-on-curing protein
MNYWTKTQLVTINRLTTTIHGGNFVDPSNFLNENVLDFLIEAVQSELSGEPINKTIFEKAGVYIYNIIANHIFTD